MQKKQIQWKPKGMNQDLGVSSFNPDFCFESRNLRLSSNDGNTLMSLVTERGPLKQTFTGGNQTLIGYAVGVAVLNHQIVLFTTLNKKSDETWELRNDHIYVLAPMGNSWVVKKHYACALNLSTQNPLETLISYESESIQKVYWTDGRNQPRVINIASNIGNNLYDADGKTTFFDFIPAVGSGSLTVTKTNSSSGLFAPGVIQYCFSYFNTWGQQSNIVDVSPLYYLSHSDRGASPEEKVSNSFTLKVSNCNKNFKYIRFYSIQRTSLDDVPIVKLLGDVPISSDNNNSVSMVDTGSVGSQIDPTELLYVGGHEITALTMTDKTGTLFLGNIKQKIGNVADYLKADINSAINVSFNKDSAIKSFSLSALNGVYAHTSELNHSQRSISTFKGGETYRFGVQFQSAAGEWTEPVWVGDEKNTLYPSVANNVVSLPYASATFNPSSISGLTGLYKKIRPVIVYPSIEDRTVLCQGVLNPTVFNAQDRSSNSPYSQASWFFRPILPNGLQTTTNTFLPDKAYVVDEYISISSQEGQSITGYGNAYVLVMGLVDWVGTDNINYANEILKQGFFVELPSDGSPAKSHYFNLGVIHLGTLGSNYSLLGLKNSDFTSEMGETIPVYAFLSSEPWFPENDGTSFINPVNGEVGTYTTYSVPGKFYPKVANYTIDLPSSLSKNSLNLLYASTTNAAFQFKVGTTLITVGFNKIESGSIEGRVSNRGGELPFQHYSPLIGDSLEASNVEIQGALSSTKLWSNVFTPSTETNTEFFIDNNIVTLNSPDLEFDTMVQSYSFDNLKLRIVGYIPIVSSASSNYIDTDSGMLGLDSRSKSGHFLFGVGSVNSSIVHSGGGNSTLLHMCGDYLWNDAYLTKDTSQQENNGVVTSKDATYFKIYPWHRSGSLNNDWRDKESASSWLSVKKMSNLLYSFSSVYNGSNNVSKDVGVSSALHLTENDYLINYRLKSSSNDVNYYPNIDKLLYNTAGYAVYSKNNVDNPTTVNSLIPMKYKSTTHAALSLSGSYILPNTKPDTLNVSPIPFENSNFTVPKTVPPYLWLGELIKESTNKFGGSTDDALYNNRWLVAGEEKEITANTTSVTLQWLDGDTYYQRYDCLKTYAFTPDDTNQIVEILSFMCETRVNIDGRYDKNRGLLDNTEVSPRNFNLLNDVYSQKANYFSYRVLNNSLNTVHYPNTITYSKTKTLGAGIDAWTNITLASTLDMDGNKGEITSLQKFNDQLICFQESGIGVIHFNENTMLSTTEGVPVEIANSNKVSGKTYLSNNIGCGNKWSICSSPSGLYFIDGNEKNFYLFNGGIVNLSIQGGMNSWSKQHLNNIVWTAPSKDVNDWSSSDGYVSYYDRQNRDIMFIGKGESLHYSELIGAFTSFYDYGGLPWFCNFEDKGLWVRSTDSEEVNNPVTELWLHNGNEDVCDFFGNNKPYWITYVGNPDFTFDKIFANLEFRATVTDDGANDSNGSFIPNLPFNHLEVWNDYQYGESDLKTLKGVSYGYHHTSDGASSLKRKFKIWRCDIPRDMEHKFDRIRSPWAYIKIKRDVTNQEVLPKLELHDMMLSYYI